MKKFRIVILNKNILARTYIITDFEDHNGNKNIMYYYNTEDGMYCFVSEENKDIFIPKSVEFIIEEI